MRFLAVLVLGAVVLIGAIAPAAAYVGPGAGLSLVGAFWGLLVAILAALSFVILWPLRRLFRRNPAGPADAAAEATDAPAETVGAPEQPRSRPL